MPKPSSIDLHYLIDVSQDAEGLEHAISSVSELSFKHDAYFSIFGDTERIAACLAKYPYEAEFVETVHCPTSAVARAQIAEVLHTTPHAAIATSQLSSDFSRQLIDSGCLLPRVTAPALTAIVPVIKDTDAGDRDRYCPILDIEAHLWPTPNRAEVLLSLATPIVHWFSMPEPLRVGVLTAGEGTQGSSAQQDLLEALLDVGSGYASIGALSPVQMMLGAADLALNVGEGGAMFVRTLEATFVAAEALVQRETQGVRGRLGVRIFRDRLEKLRDYGNIESYGGSPLLGVIAPCVMLRPDAGTRAWMNALRILRKMHDTDVVGDQRASLEGIEDSPYE